MLYLTCTTITCVDLAHYGVSRAKDWVSVDCGARCLECPACGRLIDTGVRLKEVEGSAVLAVGDGRMRVAQVCPSNFQLQ